MAYLKKKKDQVHIIWGGQDGSMHCWTINASLGGWNHSAFGLKTDEKHALGPLKVLPSCCGTSGIPYTNISAALYVNGI